MGRKKRPNGDEGTPVSTVSREHPVGQVLRAHRYVPSTNRCYRHFCLGSNSREPEPHRFCFYHNSFYASIWAQQTHSKPNKGIVSLETTRPVAEPQIVTAGSKGKHSFSRPGAGIDFSRDASQEPGSGLRPPWRREWDSNPRGPEGPQALKACASGPTPAG